ncbi:diaminopimelate decarboxylase [Dongia mobilis]|uniref:Diaminopimelate decarboxylase n=1 Tax=Dongia mobilis TaxID=578943 RepID=A0A4R6WQ85_9PROT|nr:diaminopimelate decarboxylase [Dongia mobilis]TDQ80433.1 diaminopimelate decarboxylase [Dongia mobilis]
MDDSVSPRKAALAAASHRAGLLAEEAPLIGIIDMDALRGTIDDLRSSFPNFFRHAFAAKANTMPAILKFVRDAGMSCEVASPGEFEAAQAAGFAGEEIVFDSPAKTRWEIDAALKSGATLNIDNWQELARVDDWLAKGKSSSIIGIRVNPQVGIGAIAAMSTATRTSKFGIGLEDGDNRARILAAYEARPWLTALHCHVGSQGCPLELIAAGIAKTYALAVDINASLGRKQIATLDIGGGLPVNFESDRVLPSFRDYVASLKAGVPGLFSGEFKVVTEFGRSVLAKAGIILARVEYTKETGGHPIAITHAGAQVATRTVFMPDLWKIRVSALDPQLRPKTGERIEQDVAGPCCFAGDVVAHARPLPRLDPGDFVMLHDTGAYYFSTPFVYNSLPAIPVYGASGAGDALKLTELQRGHALV